MTLVPHSTQGVLRIVLFLLFGLVLGNFLRAADAEKSQQSLTVLGLKDSYPASAAIDFTLVRNAQAPVTFACSAEVLVDGEFKEFRWDIFQNALKAASNYRTRNLEGDSMKLKWDIPGQMISIRPEAGYVYRLRIDVFTPKPERIYSPQFSIRGTK